MCFPSGDQVASKLPAGSSVRRVALPVFRSISQISACAPATGRGARLETATCLPSGLKSEIGKHSRISNDSHRSSGAVQPRQLRFGFGRLQEHERAVRGDRESGVDDQVASDLDAKAHGIAFQLTSLAIGY